MSVSIESLTKGLEKLIAKFDADSAHYLSKAYGEAQARNVFKNNPDLTAKQLNEVVQRLLDRIVCVLEPCYAG